MLVIGLVDQDPERYLIYILAGVIESSAEVCVLCARAVGTLLGEPFAISSLFRLWAQTTCLITE